MVNRSRQLKKRQGRRTFRVRNGLRRNSTRAHRLSVFRSNSNIYVQLINDETGSTVCAVNTLQSEVVSGNGNNVEAAKAVGRKIAELALAHGVNEAAFDRGSYRYHGRVAAVAEAAREAGLDL
ncbi:MAG: 50S ribosomal protein L18 [Planctomycetota bacterium]|nr:50S ribosomal protein L18 [Planctomycetota bacterium]MDA1248248.1 50S ribosomal protein L18 [Planctomycetota bacterium]